MRAVDQKLFSNQMILKNKVDDLLTINSQF